MYNTYGFGPILKYKYKTLVLYLTQSVQISVSKTMNRWSWAKKMFKKVHIRPLGAHLTSVKLPSTKRPNFWTGPYRIAYLYVLSSYVG